MTGTDTWRILRLNLVSGRDRILCDFLVISIISKLNKTIFKKMCQWHPCSAAASAKECIATLA
jgi:hypothetical protein